MAKEYKYIVLKFDLNNNSLIDFFNSLFNSNYVIKNNLIIYSLEDDKAYKEYNLRNMIELIKIDFNTDIKIFETNIFNTKNIGDFEILFDIYNKTKAKDYTNLAILSQVLYKDKAYINELNQIKVIINKIMNDNNEFVNISNAMFKNNLNVSRSATDAFMHRNTLINKLDILNKKIGFNIQNFQDAFMLYLFMNNN
ncbi:MAG: helix-turn-helix domain-containing protein [Bacilli bacterium]|nr:helix-turn-helix domain-containing protein [Bacilli bacterium]